jgi:hypothetical protein
MAQGISGARVKSAKECKDRFHNVLPRAQRCQPAHRKDGPPWGCRLGKSAAVLASSKCQNAEKPAQELAPAGKSPARACRATNCCFRWMKCRPPAGPHNHRPSGTAEIASLDCRPSRGLANVVFLLKMSLIIAIPAAVQTLMALSAERDEVVLRVVTQCTSVFQVVNIEILCEPTYLTSPTIASKHLPAKRLVGPSVQAKRALSRDTRSHDAFGIRSKNSCRCEVGSSW